MGGNYDFVLVDEVLVNVRFKYFGVLKFWYIYRIGCGFIIIFFYWLKYLYFVGIIVWYYIMIKCV